MDRILFLFKLGCFLALYRSKFLKNISRVLLALVHRPPTVGYLLVDSHLACVQSGQAPWVRSEKDGESTRTQRDGVD